MASPQPRMIAEAARQAGLTARAVRYYERIWLLAALPRTQSNYRIYDERAVARLRFIARCRALGYTIGEIRSFSDGSMAAHGSRKGTSAEAREQLRLVAYQQELTEDR